MKQFLVPHSLWLTIKEFRHWTLILIIFYNILHIWSSSVFHKIFLMSWEVESQMCGKCIEWKTNVSFPIFKTILKRIVFNSLWGLSSVRSCIVGCVYAFSMPIFTFLHFSPFISSLCYHRLLKVSQLTMSFYGDGLKFSFNLALFPFLSFFLSFIFEVTLTLLFYYRKAWPLEFELSALRVFDWSIQRRISSCMSRTSILDNRHYSDSC